MPVGPEDVHDDQPEGRQHVVAHVDAVAKRAHGDDVPGRLQTLDDDPGADNRHAERYQQQDVPGAHLELHAEVLHGHQEHEEEDQDADLDGCRKEPVRGEVDERRRGDDENRGHELRHGGGLERSSVGEQNRQAEDPAEDLEGADVVPDSRNELRLGQERREDDARGVRDALPW